MILYPEDIYERLEFDKILVMLSGYCIGDKAKQQALNLRLFHSASRLEQSLEEIEEFLRSIELQLDYAPEQYQSIDEDLFMLRKHGYVLDIDQHLRIFKMLRIIFSFYQHYQKEECRLEFPRLLAIAEQIELDAALLKAYSKVFDEEGRIRDNASTELVQISKSIKSQEQEITKLFDSVLVECKRKGVLEDSEESIKNGRRVLSVKSEYKRKIKGLIHDESATGKTVFIEPDLTIEPNLVLQELFVERKKEIYRILQNLSNEIRPYHASLELWQKIIVRLDLIQAKAYFAKSYQGSKPKLVEDAALEIVEGRHPLLKILNDRAGKETVPFSLSLNKENRILLISGPNAGGKSVTMKAVGLMQLMFQSGMLVPLDDGSKLGIYKSIFVDIGDQQSLENDLSTYSSRMLHMKNILERAGNKSLVLIDEFGSGTDPQAGGAIAESILKRLLKKSCQGVITTHYSNIKMFAHKEEGIINAAMLFDKKQLSPLYVLELGKPGSSYAFEIARKMGLDDNILNYAKDKAGKHNQAVDKLLIDLQEEKKILEKKLAHNERDKKGLQNLIKSYDSMSKDIDFKRKKFKMKEKDFELNKIASADRDLQKLIEEIKSSKDEDKAKALSQELRNKRKTLKKEIINLGDEVSEFRSGKIDWEPKQGDFVKLNGGGESGKIVSIKDGKAVVEMGIMSLEVSLSSLEPAKENIVQNKKRSVNSDLVSQPSSMKNKLDLRGYSKSDAAVFLQEFLDTALLSGHNYFEILHGKGNGILRKLVKQKLKDYPDFSEIRHPQEEFGGDGITMFNL